MNMAEKHLFTSESVTEGHPDKICDKISDAVLDTMLTNDPDSRVACETLVSTGLVVVTGEITTKTYVDITTLVRGVLKDIGYTNPEYGLDYQDCAVLLAVREQSKNISVGIDNTSDHEQGAGDQGMMFGYACDETKQLMPLPITLAHNLSAKLTEVRKTGLLKWVRPDGKSQVTIEYEDDKPKAVEAVVIAVQHDPDIPRDKIRAEIWKHVVLPVIGDYLPEAQRDEFFTNKFRLNETGIFVTGGPEADVGLTGRKIIVDTYGGMGRHGGGCFSGKDPSKVDRSAAYMARYIAKNVVAAGIASRCEVQLSYSIGWPEPISVYVTTFGTGKIPDQKISELIRKNFKLRPVQIVEDLKLKRPIYSKTAAYGHFGREDPDFTWEQTDKAAALRKDAGL